MITLIYVSVAKLSLKLDSRGIVTHFHAIRGFARNSEKDDQSPCSRDDGRKTVSMQ